MLTRESFVAASVAPPGTFTRAALRMLGRDIDRVEAAAATKLRAGVSFALAGVRTKPTELNPEGVSRGALVRRCGRVHAFKIGDGFDAQPVCCRQRACPACARARARKNTACLQRAMQARRGIALRSPFLFGTLTQVKRARHEETPREAVCRIVATWQSITNAKTATGRTFARYFAGGLRTTETTYAQKGDKHHNGDGEVRFSGYHAHLHLLLEVREGIDRGEAIAWLRRTWIAHSTGASPASQVIRIAREQDAAQLCKYVTKPLELSCGSPAILRELFGALHGVRLLQAFGEWQGRAKVQRDGWRALGEEKSDDDAPALPRWQGPEIGDLLRTAKVRHEGTTDRVSFIGRVPGDETLVSAAEAWTLIELAAAARLPGAPAVTNYANPQRRSRSGAPPPSSTNSS